MSNETISNKTILITGASSGIGRELAVQLAQKGNRLILVARREDRLLELVKSLPNLDQHLFFPCDVSDEKAVQHVCESLLEEGTEIDLLLMNAGMSFGFNVNDINLDHFHHEFKVNYFHTLYFLKYLLPGMIERKRGTIAAVTSLAAYRGMPESAPYCSSKAALYNLMESLRIDLWRTGVKCVIISPGFVKSEITDRNTFQMPFLMDTDKAAARIIRGLEKGKLEIHFPYRMSMFGKFIKLLPHGVYTRLMQGKRD